MSENLVVSVLGNRDSGKSHTWNTLFRAVVRTGSQARRLYLDDTQYVEVFVVSGSPEERDRYVGDIIGSNSPRIVLCSMQYRADVGETIRYFVDRDYLLFVHWLNPGFSDPDRGPDSLASSPRYWSRHPCSACAMAEWVRMIASARCASSFSAGPRAEALSAHEAPPANRPLQRASGSRCSPCGR